jgi:hypothetical protein
MAVRNKIDVNPETVLGDSKGQIVSAGVTAGIEAIRLKNVMEQVQ